MLGCAIVRIFRADMFECCQQRHLPFCKDFKLQGSKVRNGGADFNGQGVVWGCAYSLRVAGNLIEVATDFSVFGGQPANGGQQFIIDRGNGNDGAYGRPCNGFAG